MPRSRLPSTGPCRGGRSVNLDAVSARPHTLQAYRDVLEDVRTLLALKPTAKLDEVVADLPWSRRGLQHALSVNGTSFSQEKRAVQLDRGAQVLLEQSGRGQRISLLNAGRAAGDRDPRHLCGLFRERYGVTAGRLWSLGCSVRELKRIVEQPAPHSRRESAAYTRRRRRIMRAERRLRGALRQELVPDTVVAGAVTDALDALDRSRRGRARRGERARPRRRPRARRSP